MRDGRRPLLERERELLLLDDRLGAATRSNGGLVIVRGPMGTGKTRLLEAVEERAAAAGAWVLSARAGEFEQAFSFGLVRQLLAPALQRLVDERRGILSGAARLSARVVFGPEVDAPVGDDAAYAVLHGLYWLCVELAIRRPLLLTVDDAHWGDSASLRWLNYLVRRIAGVSVTLVVATRAPAEPQLQLLAALGTLPDVEVVELAGLSSRAVRDLLERELGGPVDEAVSRAAVHATGGNPLLVEALARAIAASPAGALQAIDESGPAAVERQVRERLAELGPDVSALSAALAVLGAAATVERAAALAKLASERAGACRDTLFRAGLVDDRLPVTFVHPLLRSAVLAGLEPSRRSRLHRRAAELLAADRASPDEIAVHLLQVDPAGEPWVTARLREAARAARAAGAPESAVTYLRRALAECSSAEAAHVLEELGQAEAQAGLPEAADQLRAAREAALESAQRTRLALLEAGRARRARIPARRSLCSRRRSRTPRRPIPTCARSFRPGS